jgi:hypothetical protein
MMTSQERMAKQRKQTLLLKPCSKKTLFTPKSVLSYLHPATPLLSSLAHFLSLSSHPLRRRKRKYILTQAQVRAAVRNYDEDLPANTIRAWTIGLLLTTLVAGINCLFSLGNPSIAITTYVVQLIAYPLGKGGIW